MGERYLTVAQAAQVIGTTDYTIRRWIREQKIKAFMPGGYKLGYKIPVSEIKLLMHATDNQKGKKVAGSKLPSMA